MHSHCECITEIPETLLQSEGPHSQHANFTYDSNQQ